MSKRIPSKLSLEQLTVARNGYIESLEVKENFTPQADDHVDLGSPTKEFKDAYIDGKANIDTLQNGGSDVLIGDDLVPDADDAHDLGSPTAEFKDLHLDGLAYIDQLGEDLDANAKEIKNVKHILRKATVNPTPGVSGSYGTGVDIAPSTGYYGIIPIAGTITWGGTFAAGETVTVRVTATYSDGTTASITRDRTDTEGTGTEEISITDLLGLLKDGVAITKLTVDSMSDQASTTVTTSATIGGRNT